MRFLSLRQVGVDTSWQILLVNGNYTLFSDTRTNTWQMLTLLHPKRTRS